MLLENAAGQNHDCALLVERPKLFGIHLRHAMNLRGGRRSEQQQNERRAELSFQHAAKRSALSTGYNF